MARYPSIKGYAIDSKETTLHTVSYTWFVNLEGNPQAMDYLHGLIEFFWDSTDQRWPIQPNRAELQSKLDTGKAVTYKNLVPQEGFMDILVSQVPHEIRLNTD